LIGKGVGQVLLLLLMCFVYLVDAAGNLRRGAISSDVELKLLVMAVGQVLLLLLMVLFTWQT
jgi:hypothetical protein